MYKKDSTVIYHAQCTDGFAAAFAAWLKLGSSADYVALEYGAEPPNVTGRAVYIVDFSFPRDTLEAMEAVATKVVVLDHHQTAIDKLSGYRCTCGIDRLLPTAANARGHEPVAVHRHTSHAVLDASKAGARLAWEYFHGQFDVPELILFVEDGDLWKFRFGDQTRHYLAKLNSLPRDFAAWDKVFRMDDEERAAFLSAGAAMHEMYRGLVESVAREALPISIMGHEGLMVCGNRALASDVGERLAQASGRFGLVWTLERSGQVKVSLRGFGGFEVRSLAEAFGGGGHPYAASMRLPFGRLQDMMSGVLNPSP